MHIVSAQLAELELTFSKQTVDSRSNEILAAQALLKELDIRGCMLAADAMNCRTESAKIILEGKGDYLLCAKGLMERFPNLVLICNAGMDTALYEFIPAKTGKNRKTGFSLSATFNRSLTTPTLADSCLIEETLL